MAEEAGRGKVDFEVATLLRTCVASTDEAAWKIARRTIEDRANPVRGEWLTHYSTAIQQMARKSLVGSPETVAATVREYEEAGATVLHLGFVAHSVDTLLEQLETFVKDVAPLVEE
jgi:alkanesulfonate monooxygenase SsuD/methylene tetrahydromethanopterin reductase-like flavin-dependent oxidoreductase (luciferase family)